MNANKQQQEEVLMVKTLDANSIYKESNGTVSGTQNVNNNSGNECSIKENENNASGNENNRSEHQSMEQGVTNTTPDSSDMSNNGREADQDDNLAKERELLASLNEQMKREIDESKQNNKSLESSKTALQEANTFLNNEIKRYQDSNFVKNARLECATAYGLLEEHKVKSEKNNLKNVSKTSPRESIGSNDMVDNYYLEEAKKKAQIQKEQALNSKSSVLKSARLPNTISGSKPKPRNSHQQPRNWPPSMSSRVSNKVVNIAEPPRNSKPFLNSKNLACPTCKKCIYTANHDACILQYLSEVNSCNSSQKKGAQSSKTTKRYIPVEKKSDANKHERQVSKGHRFSPNKTSAVYMKKCLLDLVLHGNQRVESSLLLVLDGFPRGSLLELASTRMIMRYH
ncbi:hypothetical protein Tco_0173720 [Tanacetum coccineum]